MRPSETKSSFVVDRFGPVGMSLELIHPAFTIRIKSIQNGSAAETPRGLKLGRLIESINGEKLKDIDPRIQLGDVITVAEAKDGVMRFLVAEKPGGPTPGGMKWSYLSFDPPEELVVDTGKSYLKQQV